MPLRGLFERNCRFYSGMLKVDATMMAASFMTDPLNKKPDNPRARKFQISFFIVIPAFIVLLVFGSTSAAVDNIDKRLRGNDQPFQWNPFRLPDDTMLPETGDEHLDGRITQDRPSRCLFGFISHKKILADYVCFEECSLGEMLFRVMLPAAKNGPLASGA